MKYISRILMLARKSLIPQAFHPVNAISAYLQSRVSQTRIATGVLLPSGKVRVGVLPLRSVSSVDEEYERTASRYEVDSVVYKPSVGRVRTYYFFRQRDCLQLGLSAVPNCHKPPRRHGLRGITSRGRENVKECSYLLERRYGRRLGFYTLTCPYTDEESIYLFNQNIRYIQRSYFQELKREYERQGATWSYVSVLEFQTERFNTSGVPVLHIHYISPCYLPDTWTWVCTADTLRSLWMRVIQNCCGIPCDTLASVDAQVIHSSAVGYISKYLSKGGQPFQFLAQNAHDQFPSQWWSTSRNLRHSVSNLTVSLPSEVAQFYMSGAGDNKDNPYYLKYSKDVFVKWNDRELLVGVSGQINDVAREILIDYTEIWHML